MTSEAIRQAEEALNLARDDLNTRIIHDRAQAAHVKAQAYRQLAEQFGPTGLRHQALKRAIGPVQEQIQALGHELFGKGATVSVDASDPDMPLTVGGLPFEAIATKHDPWNSNRLRLRALVQILAAQHDGSAMIIVDRAEALSEGNLLGLGNALIRRKLAALVLRVTDEARRGEDPLKHVGRTWVLENGKARTIDE